MLVLTRKDGGCVVLRDMETKKELGTIRLVEADRGKARLGFTFSGDIEILREELLTQGADNGTQGSRN